MKFGNLTTLHEEITLEELTKTNNVLLIYFSEYNTPLCTKQLLSFKEDFENSVSKKIGFVGCKCSNLNSALGDIHF